MRVEVRAHLVGEREELGGPEAHGKPQALRIVVLQQVSGVLAHFDGGRISEGVAHKVDQPRHLLSACPHATASGLGVWFFKAQGVIGAHDVVASPAQLLSMGS